jgi:NAD(P)-dependent dehydrogenase (short-subunit alcohol dehydrogenase family)
VFDIKGKTAIVTGGKKGLGNWFCDFLTSHGCNVKDYSLSSGLDIQSLDTKNKLLQEARYSDFFINCAHAGYTQCELLEEVYRLWRWEDKLIINVGANQFSPAIWSLVELPYSSQKAALHVLASRLQQEQRKCRLTMIRPGVLDTTSTTKLGGNKVDKSSFLSLLLFVFSLPPGIEIPDIAVDAI